jgi:hypothetical protein
VYGRGRWDWVETDYPNNVCIPVLFEHVIILKFLNNNDI